MHKVNLEQDGKIFYHCSYCKIDFSSNNDLLRHTRTHNCGGNNQFQSKIINFTGIRLVNPPCEHLCYMNASVNGFLNCKYIMNLVKSASECDVINRLKYLVNGSGDQKSTERLREWLIVKGLKQFEGKHQMDADEFIRCLFQYSEPLTDLCKLYVASTNTCNVCSELTRTTDTCIGLQEPISGDSINDIIQNNRMGFIQSYCNKCKKNTEQLKI